MKWPKAFLLVSKYTVCDFEDSEFFGINFENGKTPIILTQNGQFIIKIIINKYIYVPINLAILGQIKGKNGFFGMTRFSCLDFLASPNFFLRPPETSSTYLLALLERAQAPKMTCVSLFRSSRRQVLTRL